MKTKSAHAAGDAASDIHDYRPRFPFATLKAVGRAVYRSQDARDYACLLDLDPEVVSWQSLAYPLTAIGDRSGHHHVDFEIRTVTDVFVADIPSGHVRTPAWLPGTLAASGHRYLSVSLADLNPVRLANARDLVRYARYEAALGDRVRLLAALDEMGSLTLAECLTAVREGRAMETIASLVLRGHLDVDLDETLLGPDTVVRRGAK